MKTAIRERSGSTIVDVTGNIDMGTSPSFRKTLLESLKNTPRLVVNLREVLYVDSSGIASLVEETMSARKCWSAYSSTTSVFVRTSTLGSLPT